MSEKRGFVAFLVTLLMPFILILVGAGMVGGGFSLGWNWAIIPGLVVAAAGVLWGAIVFFLHGPIDFD
ncbi:MAG: hypothetical protein CMJ94_06995 [Planctomycetes bacterium]|nr:hypothetical protein [Planctomycetota bacterium]